MKNQHCRTFLVAFFYVTILLGQVSSFAPTTLRNKFPTIHSKNCMHEGLYDSSRHGDDDDDDDDESEYTRRGCMEKLALSITSSAALISSSPCAANAATADAASKTDSNIDTKEMAIQTFRKGKSRVDGYEVRRSKDEWTALLTNTQLNVLRRAQTERQRSSILEKEKRDGRYECAGCNRPLFSSSGKFDSGTGWPSFDSPISYDAVEIEEVSVLQAIDGAEVRCKTCGSHLGDYFVDGWRYGSKTGKRYCINGAALLFLPSDGGKTLRGDFLPPNKVIQY